MHSNFLPFLQCREKDALINEFLLISVFFPQSCHSRNDAFLQSIKQASIQQTPIGNPHHPLGMEFGMGQ